MASWADRSFIASDSSARDSRTDSVDGDGGSPLVRIQHGRRGVGDRFDANLVELVAAHSQCLQAAVAKQRLIVRHNFPPVGFYSILLAVVAGRRQSTLPADDIAMLRITVWNEFRHERDNDTVRALYPDGIHQVLAEALAEHLGDQAEIRTATLDEPQHGLTADVLAATDVLTWWGHGAHDEVQDAVVDAVQQRVLEGMGLLVLHSAHASKIFRRLMGTGCMLRWREAAERERIWTVSPGHPICEGLQDEHFELPRTEMYGEFFDIPAPDELVFISWFEGGEVFRSGCTFHRGKGRIFYFRPGHETFPIYYDENVRRILANGVRWAAPQGCRYVGHGRNIVEPLSPIAAEHQVEEDLH